MVVYVKFHYAWMILNVIHYIDVTKYSNRWTYRYIIACGHQRLSYKMILKSHNRKGLELHSQINKWINSEYCLKINNLQKIIWIIICKNECKSLTKIIFSIHTQNFTL